MKDEIRDMGPDEKAVPCSVLRVKPLGWRAHIRMGEVGREKKQWWGESIFQIAQAESFSNILTLFSQEEHVQIG